MTAGALCNAGYTVWATFARENHYLHRCGERGNGALLADLASQPAAMDCGEDLDDDVLRGCPVRVAGQLLAARSPTRLLTVSSDADQQGPCRH